MKIEQIRNKAETLLKDHNLVTPPIDVDFLSTQLGVRIRYEELEDDISGFLLIKNGKSVIAVNKAHHPNRKRFTIAHELGHFVLHTQSIDDFYVDKKQIVLRRDKKASSGENKKEIEANQWAAEILMPKFIIDEDIKDTEFDIFNDVDALQLAKRYGVSEQAISFRLANLGYSYI